MQHRAAPQFVSAAEISRNFGLWQDRAGHGPLIVTHHGRPRVALLAVDDYERLSESGGVDAGSSIDAMRLDVLAEHVIGCFVSLDRDLRFTRLNREAIVHMGRPVEELIGKTIAEVIPGFETSPTQEALRRVANGGEEVYMDIPSTIRPERMLRMRIFSYPDGVACIFRNVAHEMKSEHDAHERAALYAARDAHGGLAVCRLSVRGTLEQGEPNLARIAGFATERLRGIRLTDLLILKDRAAAATEIEAVLASGETRRFQSRLMVNGGGEREVRIAIAPVREGFAVSGAIVLLSTEDGLV